MVPLTRYVRRVREMRQNVRSFPISLAPDSDPTVRLSYIIDTAASANPFVRMKSVRVSCVFPHTPFFGYNARHNLCLVSQD